MKITKGAALAVRLHQDPEKVYRGTFVCVILANGKREETADLLRLPRHAVVVAHVEHHCGERHMQAHGSIEDGYDEVFALTRGEE